LLITLTKGIIFKEKKEVAIGEEQIGSWYIFSNFFIIFFM
jgi:hypothetical protein